MGQDQRVQCGSASSSVVQRGCALQGATTLNNIVKYLAAAG